MRINTKEGIYLAALLHDIGKFWQRASESRKVLKQQTLQMEGSICPTGKAGYATHIHALFTSEFFENFSSALPQQFDDSTGTVQIGNLSARHHKQNLNSLERIIQYADNLSSGHDRRDEAEDVSNDTHFKYKKIPLLNPFDTVFSMKGVQNRSYFPIKALAADESVFASRDISTEDSKQEDYARLWEAFTAELDKLPSASFSEQVATLLYLLKKYTWCIPSATNSMPDISLYDHLKTTAAIAACLHDSEQLQDFGALPPTFDGLKNEDKDRFALIAGDFSGIQKFIYQLSSKGAAKTLKGRSYYLNLVQDVVLQKCKAIFSVEDAHILMETGGRFQVLVPNDLDKIKEFRRFVAGVNLELRKDFDQVLYLSMGIHSFPAGNLLEENGFSEVVKSAYSKLEKDKLRRYADVIDHKFFEPMPVAGTKGPQICHVTGMDLQDHQVARLHGEDNVIISKKVEEQIHLGRWLRNARYIVKLRKTNPMAGNKEILPLEGLMRGDPENAITYRFLTGEEKELIPGIIRQEHVLQIISLNETDFCAYSSREAGFSSAFRFYGAAWTPDDVEGKTVEFTDIAEDGVNNLMAVLRMDVDNLGELFRSGFTYKAEDLSDKHLGSISRYSNMSEKLDLFFSGYLNHLFSGVFQDDANTDAALTSGPFTKNGPRQHVLPVYAGGDDVFVICRWDLAPQIAKTINLKFKSFTNDHPRVSISGGVSVVHAKFPIHKAAKDAEDAEKKSKMLSDGEKPDGKNAFCIFGQAMGWDDFDLTENFVKQILLWQKEMQSRALLGFLRDLFSEYSESSFQGRWRWRSAYRLKRLGNAYKKEEHMAELGSWLFTGSMNGKRINRLEKTHDRRERLEKAPELVDLTGLTVRWVQSLTRNK